MTRNYDDWFERGITQIDRKVAPASGGAVMRIKRALRPQLEAQGRAEVRQGMGGVPIVHYNLFYNDAGRIAPPTKKVLQAVSNVRRLLTVELGELKVYGKSNAPRLGFVVESDYLQNEFEDIRAYYAKNGVVLREDPLTEDGEYEPRWTVANIKPEERDYFTDETVLQGLQRAVSPVLREYPLLTLDGAKA